MREEEKKLLYDAISVVSPITDDQYLELKRTLKKCIAECPIDWKVAILDPNLVSKLKIKPK